LAGDISQIDFILAVGRLCRWTTGTFASPNEHHNFKSTESREVPLFSTRILTRR
jgi:hypothetical protein